MIVSIPCLKLALKLSMPFFVWLEDYYYYSYHLYDYNKEIKQFLIDLHLINEYKINPVLGFVLQK